MQGSKKCAFRRHNAKHVFKRYPEPVDTKDLTMVGVARSQCSVFAANFVEDIQFPRLLRPLMAKLSEIFIVRH